MVRVKIDGSHILDWETFHSVSSKAFGFPEFYGRNMNAWIDCLTYLDEPTEGMTSIQIEKGSFCVIELINAKDLKSTCPEIFNALIESTAFINYRNIEMGGNPQLMLSFNL